MGRPHSTSAAVLLGLAAALASLVGAAPATANPAGTNVVIGQVYGGSGSVGATHANDFVELYNPTSAAIDLAGWSVQYASATGTVWLSTPLTGSIPAHGRYLVQQAAGGSGVALPTPDASGTTAMAATSGKVALLNVGTTIPPGTACPTTNVVDVVGYGTFVTCGEGAGPAPAPSSNTAAHRFGGGCTDTDQNQADYTIAPPNPRNSAAAPTPCAVISIADVSLNEGNAGPTSFDFTVSLSQPASAGGVIFGIGTANGGAVDGSDYTGSSVTRTIAAGSSTATFSVPVTGDTEFEPDEVFTVNLTNVVGANVGDPFGVGTILNDDAPPGAQRTFVSGLGSDAGPCSRMQPCRTFQAALAQTAEGGEVVALDTAGYGPVHVDKAVSLISPPGVYAGITTTIPGTNAITIAVAAEDVVVLRGLSLSGLGFGSAGVFFQTGRALRVEGVTIAGFGGSGIDFHNGVSGARLTVIDSTIRDNSGPGVFAGTDDPLSGGEGARILIDRTRVVGNGVGVWANTHTNVTVRDSVAVSNTWGFAAVGTLRLENCLASDNGTGISSEEGVAYVAGTTVTDNDVGLSTALGGSILSRGNNTVEGNGTDGDFTGAFAAK